MSRSPTLTLTLTLLLPLACATLRPTEAPDSTAAFEGTWVYDLPSLETRRNIAILNCPDGDGGVTPRLTLPQLGSLALKPVEPGVLRGDTDQGCHWRFVATDAGLELSPAGQSCHNRVFDIDYTMNRWVLGTDGSEQVNATSHNPGGDCTFVLPSGKRTLADQRLPFVGRWRYGQPDPGTGLNVAQLFCAGSAPSAVPLPASVQLSRTGAHALLAHDDQGCTWEFDVLGGSAWLSPIPQRCQQRDGSALTLYYWSIAADEARGFDILSGTRSAAGATCGYVVTAGELVNHP